MIGYKYPTILYTDYKALELILRIGTDIYRRIARWMDRLTEYNYIVHHRPYKSNIMGLADGMSRMPGRYSQNVFIKDLDRLGMVAAAQVGDKGENRSDKSRSDGPKNPQPPIQKTYLRWRNSN